MKAARRSTDPFPKRIPLKLVRWSPTGLINPNVVRAVGKYGKHLSLHYKLIAWGLMGVWGFIVILLVVVMVSLGFRAGR